MDIQEKIKAIENWFDEHKTFVTGQEIDNPDIRKAGIVDGNSRCRVILENGRSVSLGSSGDDVIDSLYAFVEDALRKNAEYERKKQEEKDKEMRLCSSVREWFERHPGRKFCDASYPLAGSDYKIVGIEKVAEGIFSLKTYTGGGCELTHWGLDVLAGVVSAMRD